MRFHKKRNQFCYVQTPGFEQPNGVFGVENQLVYISIFLEGKEQG